MKALFEIEWDGDHPIVPGDIRQLMTSTMLLMPTMYKNVSVRAVEAFTGTLPAGEKAFVDDGTSQNAPDIPHGIPHGTPPWPYTAAGEFIRWLSMLPNFASKTLHIEVVVKQ